jgi:hypothetical protein
MQWYKITLSTKQIGAMEQLAIWQEFMRFITPIGMPKDTAMFIDVDPEYTEDRNNLVTLSIYFSPKAAELCPQIINRYQGSPCEKPDREMVKLFGGHKDSVLLLYDEHSLLQ